MGREDHVSFSGRFFKRVNTVVVAAATLCTERKRDLNANSSTVALKIAKTWPIWRGCKQFQIFLFRAGCEELNSEVELTGRFRQAAYVEIFRVKAVLMVQGMDLCQFTGF